MVYRMVIYVDGGCRGNGMPGAVGAAAAVIKYRYGSDKAWTRDLPAYPLPTNQKAEITAIILALELAVAKNSKLRMGTRLNVRIYSDSKYAIGCLTDWVDKWSENGWTNAAGRPVANKDLIQEAYALDCQLRMEGSVSYVWIPRAQNEDADGFCNRAMDRMEDCI